VPFTTVPLHAESAVVMDLCGEHLRGLIGRRLSLQAFQHLRRQLATLGLHTAEIFLLHDAFYDLDGRAKQPVFERFDDEESRTEEGH
jgi:hypothetical protein